MSVNNGRRRIRVAVQEDERLVNKPDALLECERINHPWAEVRNGEGVKELEVFTKRGRQITEVAEVERCPRCGTRRRLIFSYPDFDFIKHVYDERPEGAKPLHIPGAERLRKADKHKAVFARRQDQIVLVDA